MKHTLHSSFFKITWNEQIYIANWLHKKKEVAI